MGKRKLLNRKPEDMEDVGALFAAITELYPNALLHCATIGAKNEHLLGNTMICVKDKSNDELVQPIIFTMLSTIIDNLSKKFGIERKMILAILFKAFDEYDKEHGDGTKQDSKN